MRVFWAFLWLFVPAAPGWAAPVKAPPEDFAAAQYVDGEGCVHRRNDGGEWVALRDKSGALVCGFPPTPLPPGIVAEERSAVATDKDSPGAEELLMGTLASGLRQGEFLADPRPVEPRRDPGPGMGSGPVAAELAVLARREAALRGALSGGNAVGSDLCRLLGYRPAPDPVTILGGDVTLGLCPGMRAALPEERFTDPAVTRKANAGSAAGERAAAGPDTAEPAPKPAQLMRKAAPSSAAAAGPAVRAGVPAPAVAPQSRPKARPEASGGEMIPATARFVQIGAFASDQAAVAAIRRLSAMGYPVAQKRMRQDGRPLRLILAGPFKDRRALIMALNRLRGGDYPNAVAR